LRLSGNVARYAGKTLVNIYDLIIFGPLWLETTIIKKVSSSRKKTNLSSTAVNPDYQEAV